jgi:hypothetical protein
MMTFGATFIGCVSLHGSMYCAPAATDVNFEAKLPSSSQPPLSEMARLQSGKGFVRVHAVFRLDC